MDDQRGRIANLFAQLRDQTIKDQSQSAILTALAIVEIVVTDIHTIAYALYEINKYGISDYDRNA